MQVKRKHNTILALDQALHQSGYAVFNEQKQLLGYGIITPNKQDVGARRFCTVRDKIKEIYEQYKPNIVVLEPPKGDGPESEKGATTFSVLNGTYWMNRMIAEDYYCEEYDIPAAVWQNRIGAFSRDRTTRKMKAREHAMKEFNLPGDLEQDIYDACVLGWTYFYNKEFTPGETSWIKEEKKETMAEREKRSAF